MKSSIYLFLACLVLLASSSLNAATVAFHGDITAGGSGTAVLGTFPPNIDRFFNLSINFNEQTPLPSFATITSGNFNVEGPVQNFTVTGGTIIVSEGGANDTATFLVNVSGPATGQLIFTFDANAIANSNGTLANIQAIIKGNATNFTADFSGVGAGVYTGLVSEVPEPTTCLALAGLVLGGGAWKLSRKKKTPVA